MEGITRKDSSLLAILGQVNEDELQKEAVSGQPGNIYDSLSPKAKEVADAFLGLINDNYSGSKEMAAIAMHILEWRWRNAFSHLERCNNSRFCDKKHLGYSELMTEKERIGKLKAKYL